GFSLFRAWSRADRQLQLAACAREVLRLVQASGSSQGEREIVREREVRGSCLSFVYLPMLTRHAQSDLSSFALGARAGLRHSGCQSVIRFWVTPAGRRG